MNRIWRNPLDVSIPLIFIRLPYTVLSVMFVFFFNDPATTELYPLPLPDALPIFGLVRGQRLGARLGQDLAHPDLPQVGLRAVGVAEHDRHRAEAAAGLELLGGQAGHPQPAGGLDRKSTRLNSSHSQISYAVFFLK